MLVLSRLAQPLMREHLVVHVDGEKGTVQLDGETHIISVPADVRYVSLPRPDPALREFQIDGSDSINNQTLDLDYVHRIAGSLYYRLESWMRDTAEWPLVSSGARR